MSNVIAVVNHKGGSGKTTTAINLAAGLTRYSEVTSSCLVIDMDPHGSATSTLLGKLDGEPPARSIFDVLRRAITPQDGIASTIYDENIDILPANPSLESMAKTQITPELNALSVIVMMVSLLLLLIAYVTTRGKLLNMGSGT